jgi:hypothetical protein
VSTKNTRQRETLTCRYPAGSPLNLGIDAPLTLYSAGVYSASYAGVFVSLGSICMFVSTPAAFSVSRALMITVKAVLKSENKTTNESESYLRYRLGLLDLRHRPIPNLYVLERVKLIRTLSFSSCSRLPVSITSGEIFLAVAFLLSYSSAESSSLSSSAVFACGW